MSPRQPVDPNQVKDVLLSLVKKPLKESEIGKLMNPAMNLEIYPEEALNLESNGLPTWWPKTHPETLKSLAPARRLRWFIEELAGESKPSREILRSDDEKSKRRMIARSLLHMYPEWRVVDPSRPTPDWL